MANGDIPTVQEFIAFFKQYQEACRKKDAAFLKGLLAPDVPDDYFAFVMEVSHHSTISLDKAGVQPRVKATGKRFDVVYEGDLGDGMTQMTLDFYWHEGRWLKYDPDAEA